MSGPRDSGGATARAEIGYRHVRTVMGATFMGLAVLYVVTLNVLHAVHTTPAGCPAAAATTWVDVVHAWVFPVLVFLAGLALFNRAAFGDLVSTAKSLLPGRAPPAP